MLGITTIYYETAIYAVMLGLHEQFKVYTHTHQQSVVLLF